MYIFSYISHQNYTYIFLAHGEYTISLRTCKFTLYNVSKVYEGTWIIDYKYNNIDSQRFIKPYHLTIIGKYFMYIIVTTLCIYLKTNNIMIPMR